MKRQYLCIAAAVLLLFTAGCEQSDTAPTSALSDSDPEAGSFIASKGAGQYSSGDPATERIASFVDAVNAKLAAGGSELRLDYPWLFRVGPGTDPYASLRTGARWTKASLKYVLDESDYSPKLATGDLEQAMESSFASWNALSRTYLEVTRQADDVGANPDFLDGTIVEVPGEEGPVEICPTVLDLSSPTLEEITETGGLIIDEPTDILVGGWLEPKYFELCLGASDIIGVTWSLSGGDQNGDGYADLAYVEQFYNEAFNWTTTGSVYLDFSPEALTDLETIAVHENGHALGLGHFGGPLLRQPFTLKPNGRVFNPEAVMNPFYIGGEQREPLPTDEAGLTTLYSGFVTTTGF